MLRSQWEAPLSHTHKYKIYIQYIRTYTLTHTHRHAQENMPAHHNPRHTPTQTTHTLLYSGGRLIEGYNWGARDERLSTGTCTCVHNSPSLLAMTSLLSISPLFSPPPPPPPLIQSPVKMCSHADTYNLINSTHQLYCSASSHPPFFLILFPYANTCCKRLT